MFWSLAHMESVLPVLQEIDKAFLAQFNKYDQTVDSQTNMFMRMGLENPELMKDGFKAYHKITSDFNSDMVFNIADFRDGRISFDVAVKSFKQYTGKHYEDMFMAGTRAVGNEFYDKMGMDRRSKSFINKARRAELKFFKGFLTDIKNPNHKPRHDYIRRASYYSNSAKAQFYNGMVAGAGSDMEIFWNLGIPATESCDVCPVYANHGAYTWQTLPTVPRGGDTPCLYRCYCSLEMRPKSGSGKFKGGDPYFKHSQLGLSGPPGPAKYKLPGVIADKTGKFDNSVAESLREWHNDIRGKLNKARQMIEITKGKERLAWIRDRKNLNALVIDMQKLYPDYKFLPTMAVKDLTSTIQSANRLASGNWLRGGAGSLGEGDEIYWVRGTESFPGVVHRTPEGDLVVRSGNGTERLLNDGYDIDFLVGGPAFQNEMGLRSLIHAPRVASADVDMMDMQVDEAMRFNGLEGHRLKTMLRSHMSFPITDEWIQNALAKQRALALGETSSMEEWTQPDLFGNRRFSNERLTEHDRIVAEFLAQGVDGTQFLVAGGFEGSGRLDMLAKDGCTENNSIIIDMNKIKLSLAITDGEIEIGHRTYKYEDEARIIYERLYEQALLSGKNIGLTGNMQNDVFSLSQKMGRATTAGYTVTGLYADMPLEVAQQRAFVNAFMGSSRQFVDPYAIYNQNVYGRNEIVDQFQNQNQLDYWYIYNTNVIPGIDPDLLDSHTMFAYRNRPPLPPPSYVSELHGQDIEWIKPMSGQGISDSYELMFKNGVGAIYKPEAGENKGVYDYTTDSHIRETIAYQLEKQLRWGLVPESIVLDIPIPDLSTGPSSSQTKGVGAFQKLVGGVNGAKDWLFDYSTIPDEQKQMLLALDLIQQNQDRHGNNWFYDESNLKVWAIDNGLAGPSQGGHFKLTFADDLAGRDFTPAVLEGMQRLLANKAQVYADVKEAVTYIGLSNIPAEEKRAMDRMFERLEVLINWGFFPNELSGIGNGHKWYDSDSVFGSI